MRAPSTASPLLSVTSLKKSVPGGRVLFDGLDLAVAPGEFIAIMRKSRSRGRAH